MAGPALAASPDAAGMLGELLGHLPLALWIAATRLAGHQGPDGVAATLPRGAALLDWLRVGDLSVRPRLRSAYYRLGIADGNRLPRAATVCLLRPRAASPAARAT